MTHLTLKQSTDELVVPIIVAPTAQSVSDLTAKGQVVPRPVRLDALIDTGSNVTCVSPRVIAQLGLAQVGSSRTQGVVGIHPVRIFEASITVPGPPADPPTFVLILDLVYIMEWDPPPEVSYEALLGMDVLAHLVLWYNGPRGEFVVA